MRSSAPMSLLSPESLPPVGLIERVLRSARDGEGSVALHRERIRLTKKGGRS